MKKFPPKERPTWCNLRPLLTWKEVVASADAPLWLEAKGFEHLSQWGLVDINDFTGAVTVITKKELGILKKSTVRTLWHIHQHPSANNDGAFWCKRQNRDIIVYMACKMMVH